MSQLPTFKWSSCDTLTLLRGPTKRASVWSLFSFSLLPVTNLPTESMQCSASTFSEWKSDGVKDWWSWVSSADLWWPHLLWEITSDSGWMYRVKSIGPKTEPWGTLYCDAHSKQTESYHTNRWSTNGCKADAAPPSQAVWREKLQFWHRSVVFFKLFAKDWTWGQCCCFFVFLEGCHDCLFDLQRNRHKQQWFIYNSATQRHQVI